MPRQVLYVLCLSGDVMRSCHPQARDGFPWRAVYALTGSVVAVPNKHAMTAGRAAGRSPAGFAQVAAALKARRAELAARQNVPPAGHQPPAAATTAQVTAAPEQARSELAEQRASPAAAQQEPLAAEAFTEGSHEVVPFAGPASQGQPADGAAQQQDSGAGLPRQLYGVKTRSAAREEEHTAGSTAPETSPGTHPPQVPGSVVEPSPQVNPCLHPSCRL